MDAAVVDNEKQFKKLLADTKDGMEHNDIQAYKQLVSILKINSALEDSQLTEDIINMINSTDTTNQFANNKNRTNAVCKKAIEEFRMFLPSSIVKSFEIRF